MKVELIQNAWKEITTENKTIQNTSNFDIFIQISDTEPATNNGLILKKLDKMSIISGNSKVWGRAIAPNCSVEILFPENENTEKSLVNSENWIDIPKNAKNVTVILDCSEGTSAKIIFSPDRESHESEVESEEGLITDDIIAIQTGMIAAVRMEITTNNEVEAVPTETKITFATAAPSTGDTVKFGDEVYEFTTDSETELSDPTNIRIDMDALNIIDHTSAAQGFKTVFNAETAYSVTATGDAAVITLTATDNFEEYNDLETTTSITATATATFEDTTFGGGTGASTTGVDFVAATLPKIYTIAG
ncbi:MAG TPA: hypothetical protein PLD55_04455 [bacterium]|nr:hypothetical protein [bacterium]